MAQKRFSKNITKRKQYKLTPKDAETIMRKEFVDSHNNKMNVKIDVTPQKINSPTFEWNRQYNKD